MSDKKEIGDTTNFSIKGSLDEVAKKIKEVFLEEGYKLESGDEKKGVYGKGSKIMLILLGGLAKRYTFPFELNEADGKVEVTLQNGTGSKIAGGAIGLVKHKKEFKRLIQLLETKLK